MVSKLEVAALGTIISKASWILTFLLNLSISKMKKKPKTKKLKLKKLNPKTKKKDRKMKIQRKKKLLIMKTHEYLYKIWHLKLLMRSCKHSLENMERLRRSKYH